MLHGVLAGEMELALQVLLSDLNIVYLFTPFKPRLNRPPEAFRSP